MLTWHILSMRSNTGSMASLKQVCYTMYYGHRRQILIMLQSIYKCLKLFTKPAQYHLPIRASHTRFPEELPTFSICIIVALYAHENQLFFCWYMYIDNGDVRFCKAEGLQLGDMMPSQRHQRLLILSDYDQASSFCIWKTSPSPQV